MSGGPGIGFLDELKEIVLADVVLILAFTLTLTGGITLAFRSSSAIDLFMLYLPIVAVGVTLSFVLHELMHKFVAQRYGAVAGFRSSPIGLAITLITGAFGFLLGIPGATMIYTQSFTKRENGIVSLAGPLTNFAVFGGALLFASSRTLTRFSAMLVSTPRLAAILLISIFPLLRRSSVSVSIVVFASLGLPVAINLDINE